MADYYKNNEITFPSIVMKQVSILQQITSKELRDGTRTIITPIGEQLYENEDTRYSFLQAVECFGSLLFPYFDKETKEVYESFLVTYDMELIEALDDGDFLKSLTKRFNIKTDKIKEQIRSDSKLKSELLAIFLNEKCKIARQTYRQLLICFKNNQYLTAEQFNDSDQGNLDAVDEEDLPEGTELE